MSATRPSMTTVRTYFNLGRARFATIARQPQFRGLLAPGDPPARMQAILTRLYELRNQPNARRQYRRELIDFSRAQSRARCCGRGDTPLTPLCELATPPSRVATLATSRPPCLQYEYIRNDEHESP